MSLRLKISFTIQSTLSTHRAPRNGLSLVILWKVGINHRPPIPTRSISNLCHLFRRVSSPRKGITIHSVSTLSGNIRCISRVGINHAARQGRSNEKEKTVAVTAPEFQSTRPSGLPITVSAPPQLAARRMALPYTILCLLLGMTPCIMVSIITVVVRLSRLMEIRNVTMARVHSIFLLLRVRSNWRTKSKQPLLLRISTIVIVASRNITISAALPTCGRKMCREMKYLTEVLVDSMSLKLRKRV